MKIIMNKLKEKTTKHLVHRKTEKIQQFRKKAKFQLEIFIMEREREKKKRERDRERALFIYHNTISVY